MSRVVLATLCALLLAFAAPARAEGPVTFVEDRAILTKLEEKGYGFEMLFGSEQGPDLASLYANAPAYHAIVDLISSDIAALRAEMEAAGRPTYEKTALEKGRAFDVRWLQTDAARFRLVGVINRLDRRDFNAAKGEGGCGEVRFIYRLAYSFDYDKRTLASRMPFNFNAVFTAAPDADGACTGVAGRWTPQLDENVDAGWLAGGVLDREGLILKQLELNAQVTRFPSGQEPGFGGQAAYLMRIFGIDGESVTEKTLENTPDIARIAEDGALKAKLAAYVRDHVEAIDTGVYQIPDELLAKKIISFTTFGSARLGNHPFLSLYKPTDFSDLDYAPLKLLRSPEALLERLDNSTCQGCHQSGSTAGFHFIGLDEASTSPLNRIEVGVSPHFHAEQPRRAAYLEAVMRDEEPNHFRPLSNAPPAMWEGGKVNYEPAGMTMSCTMPDDSRKFANDWQCGAGTVCTTLSTVPDTGLRLAQCLLPKDSEAMFSGHPCLTGTIETNVGQPYNDRQTKTGQFAAFAKKISRDKYTCRPPRIGVPGGIAYRNCNPTDRSFASFRQGESMPNEICALVGGKKFDLCVATGDFSNCLGGAVNRGNRPACDATHFCREDYMCQSLPDDIPGKQKVRGIGFCSPTYFVFQMRVDNHLSPWDAKALDEEDRSIDEAPMYRSVDVDEATLEEEGVEGEE
jgi:hypothetical protein